MKVNLIPNFQKNVLSGLIFMLLTIFLIVYLIILPSTDNIKESYNDLLLLKVDFETKTEKKLKLQEIDKKISKIENKLYLIDNIFVHENRELEFITTLEGIARKNNVTPKVNLNISPNSLNSKYNTVNLLITSEGTFFNLYNYLSDIEKLNYYININKLEFYSNGNKNVTMRISADTYWK